MKRIPLKDSFYSRHFLMLQLMGAGSIAVKSKTLTNLYICYKLLMTVTALAGCLFIFFDFCVVFGDFKKMSWNLCVNGLLFAAVLKNICTFHSHRVITRLRKKLHKNATTRESPEDAAINQLGEKEMKYIRIIFYGGYIVFVPLWLISWYFSYLWGPRGVPIPIYIPFEWDPDDEIHYNLLFLGLGFAGAVGVVFVIETEMAMFALLIQISREYGRLLTNLRKVNKLLEGESFVSGKREVNPFLRRMRIKSLLRGYCKDQQDLIRCTNDFELSYTYAMLIQVVFLSLLMIVLAMLCILEYDNLSLNISYQIGYISILTLDMFLVCWYSTRINDQCHRVGDEAYSIFWYQMSIDLQKDLTMMIRRSQHPPKITSGNLMELNLNAFMLMMRNIYSWLTLFQQVASHE